MKGQDLLEKDRYCVVYPTIYDLNNGKKLKDKEALKLLSPYPEVYNRYKKSIKLKHISYVSGAAMLGSLGYLAGSELLDDDDFIKYNSTQKVIAVSGLGFLAIATASAIMYGHSRTKSLFEANMIIEKSKSSSYDENYNAEPSSIHVKVDVNRVGFGIIF